MYLYENHCTECHDRSVHTRKERKARSLANIDQLIIRWSTYLGLTWSKEDREDVLEYLNRRFYDYSSSAE